MTRFSPHRCTLVLLTWIGCVGGLFCGDALAIEDLWKTAANGNWELATNWVAGFTPGNTDSATFNLTGTYNVTFGVAPLSIQRLIISAGNVSFQSSGGNKTLGLDAPGGNNSLFVLGSTTTMNLGGTSSNPMTLFIPGALVIGSGGTFVSRSGSSITDLGVLQVGQIVNGVLTPSSSNFTLQSSSSMVLGSDLTIANQNVAGVTGAILVNSSSTLTQFDNAAPTAMTIGSVANGAASLTISNNSVVTTGTGLLTINPSGTLTVNATSTLNANGDIFVNGGLLTDSGSFFWANGHTMTIKNVDPITFNGLSFTVPYTTPANGVINVSGAGARLQTTLTGSDFNIVDGTTVNVGSQSLFSVSGIISVGSGTNGFLNVDGLGTKATSTSTTTPSVFGASGGIADVTFSNLATGSFNFGLNMSTGTVNFPGAVSYLTVESGATLTGVGNIAMANSTNIATSATITVTDLGSALTLANAKTLTIGQTSAGTATINVNNKGLLSLGTGGTTTLNATGTINITGGTVNLQTLVNNGGKINFNSGSLSYLGNLTIGTGGLLGTNLTLTDAHFLTLSGTTTVNAGSFLLVESGAGFNTGTLTNNGLMIFDGVNAIANLTSTNVSTNNGLIRGQGTIVLPSASNGFTNSATGEIRAEDGKRLVIQGSQNGVVTNSGKINLLGGTAEFGQPVTNTAGGLITGRGNLIVTPFTPGGTALTNQGNLALSSGITGVFGDVLNQTGVATRGITITGNSDVTFWDDVNNVVPSLFKVTPGSSVTIFGTYSGGSITGGGQMNFDGDLSPGASPAAISLEGDVRFFSTSRLKIELGGTTAGTQYDQVNVTGNLTLDGTLQVSLINGFVPHVGDVFHILNWGTLTGTFANFQFPAIAGLGFSTNQLYTTGNLPIFSTQGGDFDQDGHVNAGDISAMLAALADLNAFKTSHNFSDADLLTFGDIDHSGAITNADLQSLLELLKSGGGSVNAVPEPATSVLALLGLSALMIARRPRFA